jgi:biotin-dependent carboxylase-like uncharacterized protein
VTRPGALTTVQDQGRPGLAHVGVPRSGALDVASAQLANRLVGNDQAAAVLETTLDGVDLAFDVDVTVAVTGALAPVQVDSRAAGWALPVYVRAGQTLAVGGAELGIRNYVAVSGGFEIPLVLGSASADLLSGLGPAPLRTGDVLAIGPAPRRAAVIDLAPYRLPGECQELGIHLGPRHDWLSDAGLDTLGRATWSASPDSNRIALRLIGPPAQRRRHDELPSEGVVLGAIQSLPDGQLVIFLADHPTTGGYPVVAVVDAASLGACAQARPGTLITFRPMNRVSAARR